MTTTQPDPDETTDETTPEKSPAPPDVTAPVRASNPLRRSGGIVAAITATICVAIVAAHWNDLKSRGFAPMAADQDALIAAADDVSPVVEREIGGLNHPWGLAFLPDGGMLVTERSGWLRRIDAAGQLLPDPIAGVPAVFAEGQGGLFDVALAPDFAESGVLYLSYAALSNDGGATALMRARLDGDTLQDQRELFRMTRMSLSTRHFGGRIVIDDDGAIFLTLGDRGEAARAQELDNTEGAVVRVHADGRAPNSNPYFAIISARPEIWSVGHRNVQGAALHPDTGVLWTNEHGPLGGDEVNVERPGGNYGWPVITHGRDYSGEPIGEGRFKEGMEPPLWTWVPSIGVTGMAFYQGEMFAPWRGDILVGGLVCRCFARLVVADATPGAERIVAERRFFEARGERVRTVKVAPDGAIWLLTDEEDGKLLRVVPGAPPDAAHSG